MFYNASLSRLHFLCNFLQIDKFCSSPHCFVLDCKPAFLVHIFFPKWRPQKRKNRQKQNLRKSKSKTWVFIDLTPLMTNMAKFRSSVTYLTVKITEITEITKMLYQLYNTICFRDCLKTSNEYYINYAVNFPFSQT